MGCEQSNLSSNQKTSQIGARGKKMSFYQEESKSKDPPARPMSKMDAKTTFSSSSQASKPKAAPQQQQQTDREHKESVIKSQEISLYSNLQEELENELSRREHSETEILMKKEDREEPPYQITKEQHKEIFAFAKESCRLVHVYSQRLHEHLLKSIEENNELPSIMEYLKNSSKDVENCVDDLRVYPIQNEKKFYGELEKSRKVAREIKAEYKKYEEKAYDYSSFREIVLDNIYKYNASMEDPKQKGQSKDTNATNTREGTMTALSRPSLASPTSNANEHDHDHEKKEEWVSSGIDNEKNDYDAVASDKKTGVDTPSTQEDGVKSIVDIEALSKEKLGFEVKNEEHVEEKTEEIQDLENKNEMPNTENEAGKEGENAEKIENIEDIQLVEKPETKENGIENEIDSLIVQGETEMRERRDSKGVV